MTGPPSSPTARVGTICATPSSADRERRAGEVIDLQDDGEAGQGAADRGQRRPDPQPPERGGLAQRGDVGQQPMSVRQGRVSLCGRAGTRRPGAMPADCNSTYISTVTISGDRQQHPRPDRAQPLAAVAAAAGGDGRRHRPHLRRGAGPRAQAELRHGAAPAARPRPDDDHRAGRVGAAHPLGGQPEGGRDARRRLGPHHRQAPMPAARR